MRAMLMSSITGAMMFAATVAQAAPTTIEQEVKVPFAFFVNGHELPAGTYAVRHDDDQGDHSESRPVAVPSESAHDEASRGSTSIARYTIAVRCT